MVFVPSPQMSVGGGHINYNNVLMLMFIYTHRKKANMICDMFSGLCSHAWAIVTKIFLVLYRNIHDRRARTAYLLALCLQWYNGLITLQPRVQ